MAGTKANGVSEMGESRLADLVDKTVADTQEACLTSMCGMQPASNSLLPTIDDFRQAKKELNQEGFKTFRAAVNDKLQYTSAAVDLDEKTNQLIEVGATADHAGPGKATILVQRRDKDNRVVSTIIVPDVEYSFHDGHLSEGITDEKILSRPDIAKHIKVDQ